MAVAVPGSLKGYSTIYKAYGGGVSWESLFEPTIKLCEEGMEISEHLSSILNKTEDLIKVDTILRYNMYRLYDEIYNLYLCVIYVILILQKIFFR